MRNAPLTNEDYFKWKIQKGWDKKKVPNTQEYKDRIAYEIDVITKMGFVDYMLIIADILEFADNNGIPRGAGRGSAAGSLISYCLNITTIDPIKYGLYFERFLNPSRISMPDVDIDLGTARRHEVFEYLQRKYGEDKVASITTFGKMWSRSIIRNVGTAMGLPTGQGSDVDKIAKLFPSMERDFGECIEESAELKKYQELYPELFKKAKALAGKPKSVGVHAAGTLVTPIPIEKIFPMGRGSGNKTSVTQWDMYDVEETGFLKLDLLGLNTLDVIHRTIELIYRRFKQKIDIEGIDMEDPMTVKLFNAGKTNGLFQLERKYVQDLCRRMNIGRFEEVCALNALIRPGTLHSGATELYIKRKTGEETYVCPHPALEHALANTYGVVLYQETAMQVARDYAGFTMTEADNLRKAIGKKIAEKMAEAKKEFFEKADALGRPREVTEMIFSQIETAQKYSFNKSHAVAYGKLTFQAGWLKCHYFLEFMTELLNGEANSNEPKLDSYLRECRLNGVTILPPDARAANPYFQIEGKRSIRFGLSFVKGVSVKAIEALAKVKNHCSSFTELLMHDESGLLNKEVMCNLISVGAFDYMGRNRAALLSLYYREIKEEHKKTPTVLGIKALVAKKKEIDAKKASGVKVKKEISVDEILDEERNYRHVGAEWTLEDYITNEHELCKCYIVNNPLSPFEDMIEDEAYRDIMDIVDGHFNREKPVKLIAVLKSFNPHTITRGKSEGKEMCFLDVFDSLMEINCIAFCEVYEKVKDRLFPNTVYTFTGKFDGDSIILSDVVPMMNWDERS